MKKLFLYLILFTFLELGVAQESVVCIHGFMRTFHCMLPMGKALMRTGYDVYLWDYPSRGDTIEGHAENLVTTLNQIASIHPGEPIHFVTHSLGGIILRAALNHPQCPQEAKIGRAVLLAPPNHGASLARYFKENIFVQWFFGNKSGRQLLTYSQEEIMRLGSYPSTMGVLVVSGAKGIHFWFKGRKNDGKVGVNETVLETPHEHRIFYVGHSRIMTRDKIITLTKTWLSYQQSNPLSRHSEN